ncbi:MAG: ATP-binding cassette domain-containing protein, partial [Rhodothermales bacterium]|nr:ATP-binding cassette domain-containing protein [Rhodothermales bacterium]
MPLPLNSKDGADRQARPANLGEILRQLLFLLSPREKWMGLVLFVFLGLGAAMEMVGVGAIPLFVTLLSSPDIVLQHELGAAVFEALDVETERELVLWAAVGLVVVFLLKNAFLSLVAYMRARYSFNRHARFSNRLFEAYLRSPYTFHLQRNTAELLRNIEVEAGNLVNRVMLPLLQLVLETLTLLFIFGLLIFVEPVVSVLAGGVLGALSYFFYRAVRKKLVAFGKEEQLHGRAMLKAVQQGLGGVKEAKVLRREPFFMRTFSKSMYARVRPMLYNAVLAALPRLTLETIAVGGMLLVAAMLLAQGRSPESLIPTMTLLGVAAVRLMPSFTRIVQSLSALRWGQYALAAIFEDLNALERPGGHPARPDADGAAAAAYDGTIEVHDLHYRYPGASEEALRGVSLTIPRGEAVAFVGPSGAGKTTIVDVLLGLLPPERGDVRVEGRSIFDDLSAWQHRIGYIPQSIYLTDDTIRGNVAFGMDADEIDDAKVW